MSTIQERYDAWWARNRKWWWTVFAAINIINGGRQIETEWRWLNLAAGALFAFLAGWYWHRYVAARRRTTHNIEIIRGPGGGCTVNCSCKGFSGWADDTDRALDMVALHRGTYRASGAR